MVFLFLLLPVRSAPQEGKKLPTPEELVREAVATLVKIQEKNGQWPYEALHRDPKEEEGLPLGFRVGGTSIVGQALLFAAPDDKEAQVAVQRSLAVVLKLLEHPKMAPSTAKKYDVRIWGHGFALQFLCYVRAFKAAGEYEKEVNKWIPILVKTVETEELPGGGWTYGGHQDPPASFCTAPVTQSLLLARSQGEKVSDDLLARCRKTLEAARTKEGAFVYEGAAKDKNVGAGGKSLGGSAARGMVCETTLMLLGGGSIDAVRFALKNFYDHWDDLAERRGKAGTHQGKNGIAPYYFYFGHRYAAQAIQMLPENERAKERERLLKPIVESRNKDGNWNDRVFERARYVGTAFMILALLGDRTPLPPKLEQK
jgi:hypothetical protein